MKWNFKLLGPLAMGLILGVYSPNTLAGAFQLFEESAAALGNSFAGTGASAEDASIEFYNPAGMTLLDSPEFVFAGTAIGVDIDSHVNSASNQITIPPNPPLNVPVTGASDTQPGIWSIVPAMHFVYPDPENKFAVGFGVTAPYGLETDYPHNALSRFLATESRLLTINIGPNVAYQLTPKFSLGVGVDAQYLAAKLNQQILFLNPVNFSLIEGTITNSGDSWGYGWNAGALYQFTPTTRAGVSYRSQINHSLHSADATLEFPSDELLSTFGTVTTTVIIPSSTNLSFYHAFNRQWEFLAGVDYTNWSAIHNLTLNYSGDISNIVQTATLPIDFSDTLRYSMGVNYAPNLKWKLRSGLAFDESPITTDEARTFRLPDSNRIWASLGAQYHINRQLIVDASYAHLFVADSSTNYTTVVNGVATIGGVQIPYSVLSNAMGTFNSSVNEVGVQLAWKIT